MMGLIPQPQVLIASTEALFADGLAKRLHALCPSLQVECYDFVYNKDNLDDVVASLERIVQQKKSHVILVDGIALDDEQLLRLLSNAVTPAQCVLLTASSINVTLATRSYLSGVLLAARPNHRESQLRQLISLIEDLFDRFYDGRKPELGRYNHEGQFWSRIHSMGLHVDEVKAIVECLFPEGSTIYPLTSDVNVPSLPRPRSIVAIVSPRLREPVILKIARKSKTVLEEKNYQSHIAGKIKGYRSSRIEACRHLWNGGGIVYSLIGTKSDIPHTFTSYYITKTKEEIVSVLQNFFSETYRLLYERTKRDLFEGYDFADVSLFKQYSRAWSSDDGYRQKSRLDSFIDGFQNLNPYCAITDQGILFYETGPGLYNPIHWIRQNKDRSVMDNNNLIQSITHGDFHSENIFVDEYGHFWMIDFERSNFGPRLQDFVELETDIISRLIDLPINSVTPQEFFQVAIQLTMPNKPLEMRSIMNATPDSEIIFQRPSIEKALTIVLILRTLASNVTTYEDFREYLWGLLLNSLFLLTILPEGSAQYTRAFLYASVLCHKLDKWQIPQHPPTWPPPEWIGNYTQLVKGSQKEVTVFSYNNRMQSLVPMSDEDRHEREEELESLLRQRRMLKTHLLRIEEKEVEYIDPRNIPEDVLESKRQIKKSLFGIEAAINEIKELLSE